MKSNNTKQLKNLVSAIALASAFAPAFAAMQTVTLAVPGMSCATCPITVKKAVAKLDGVSKTEVNFDKREAVVSFDDSKTSIQKLIKATTDAGYPSSIKQ